MNFSRKPEEFTSMKMVDPKYVVAARLEKRYLPAKKK